MSSTVFDDPLANVVAYSPASTGIYLGSPSLAILDDGSLVASHDLFGPGAPTSRFGGANLTRIYRSADDGGSWNQVSDVTGAFWSSLFVHRGSLYLLGCSEHYGSIVVRRSDDGGMSWTHPDGEETGLLFRGGEGGKPPNYHCAPVPVVEHRGRLWRAFEDCPTGGWGDFLASVISAPSGGDLLMASNWTMTNKLPYDRSTDPEDFGEGAGWLEGNVVVNPAGELCDILRVASAPTVNRAAITRISNDGKRLSFDPKDFIEFPGGMSKFTIRHDPGTGLYLTISNEVISDSNPSQRNFLVLASSEDLVRWRRQQVLLHFPEPGEPVGRDSKVGFQYVDWHIDGEEIVMLVRTAFDGAHNYHDANHITFHRLARYREFID